MVTDSEITGKIKITLADNIDKKIKGSSTKNKESVSINSINGSFPTCTIIVQNNSNDEMYDELVGETVLKVAIPKWNKRNFKIKHDEFREYL